MSPNQVILFTITTKSINGMLQLQPGQKLTPLSIGDMLDLFPMLCPARLDQIIQAFILEEKYTPKYPPPYVAALFSPWGRSIVDMISRVLGYTTIEYIDEIILPFMSIYTPGHPPIIIYDYSHFIANRMHEQFFRMSNNRVFTYSSVFYHLSYITSLTNSHLPCKSWTPRANQDQLSSGPH